ncbi:MAG TPA: GntR family transcriptional regulator [Stenotrophomonas sp.]|nr:GntR family transcriptional regulator [Stenotrophomonas sp.]
MGQHCRSARPAWRRIAAVLAEEIRQGHWRNDEALPAASQLAARFGVHRHTVRKSLALLREQGLLSAQAARVIVPRLPLPLQVCLFLPEHLHGLGVAARCELRACDTVLALPPHLHERVPARLPGPLMHLAYQVMAEDQLLASTEAWLPAASCPPLARYLSEGHGLGSALGLSGVSPACRRHCWVEADGGRVRAGAGDPLALCLGVLALDAQSRPLKLCLHRFDTARVRLLF